MNFKKKPFLLLQIFLVTIYGLAQQKVINGTVYDELGQPLPGVSVVVQGTSKGTSTDFDGKFSLNTQEKSILLFSYVGYKTQEVIVNDFNTIDVTLSPDSTTLDEVVITAVGIKRKPDEITTAYESVKSDEIVAAQNPNTIQALAGKVSGLQINTTNTGVNPNTNILLRGVRSLTGSNSALVVIDNVISSATVLSNLDPNSIESINVIKGPNGAALYGSRGGNGVLIVTTKKGSEQKGRVSVNLISAVTFENIAFLPEMQDRYGKGYWGEIDAFDQGSWGPEYDGSIQPLGLPYPTYEDFRYFPYKFREDNMADFFNLGVTLQNTITVSGGDPESYYSLSGNKRSTDGIIPDDEYDKTFFALNAGKTFGKLSIGGHARYTSEKTNVVSNNLYSNLAQVSSDIDIEAFNSGSNADHWTAFATSPYWLLDNSRVISEIERTDLSLEVNYIFNENISSSLRGNVINTASNAYAYINDYVEPYTITGDSRNIQSSLAITSGNSRSIYVDFLTNFNYQLSENIELKSLVGLNFTESKSYSQSASGDILTIPGLYTASNISSGIEISDFRGITRAMALFANADFSYKDYLFLNLTGRQEWDSRLQSPGRLIDDIDFFYYSAGISFIPTKAFPNLRSDVLHRAKLSGGYVKTANISALGAHSLFDVGIQGAGFPYTTTGINSFVAPSTTSDNNIEPEFISTLEANLNLELFYFNNAPRVTIDASASFYTNDNQILQSSVSSSTGVNVAAINIGKTKTDAFEIDLGLTPFKTDNFQWNLNIGYASQKTIATKITDDSDLLGSGSPGIYAVKGEEFPLIRGSYYERDEEGRIILNSDGSPRVGSGLKILGKTTPDYILNFGTEFSYKGFKLSATADYRTGHVFYSNVYNNLSEQGRSFITAQNGRGYFIFPNSTIQGSNTTNTTVLTGPSYGGPTPYAQYQSFIQSNDFSGVDENFILDATVFKLREIALSYTLPSRMLENTFINGLSLGVSGRNLINILPKENRYYNDPEIGSGIDGYGQTPPTKFYTMNINLKF